MHQVFRYANALCNLDNDLFTLQYLTCNIILRYDILQNNCVFYVKVSTVLFLLYVFLIYIILIRIM